VSTATAPLPALACESAPRTGLGNGTSVVIRALALGLLITVCQVLLACLLSGERDPARAYLALWKWDGHWFGYIVNSGYVSPAQLTRQEHGNVAFFPAYPLLAWCVKQVGGLDTRVALLLTAQVSCWGFWSYLLLLCRRWNVPAAWTGWGVLLMATHPAAYYLVAAYSEPLFLLGTVGFLYWSERPGRIAACLAVVHGVLMTGSRLVGLPLVAYPLFRAWLTPGGSIVGQTMRAQGSALGLTWQLTRTVGRVIGPFLIGLGASLGALGFFAYCQYRFGQWDLYMKVNAVGWNVHPDYMTLFHLKLYRLGSPQQMEMFWNRVVTLSLLLAFAAALAAEVWLARKTTGWGQRAPLYFCAWMLFYVPVCGHWTRGLACMVRFAICVQPVLGLAVLHLLARTGPARPRPWMRIPLAIAAAACLAAQLMLTFLFTRGCWVA
jgi:hypothetical protein